MTTIELRFPAHRFHATPWGRHVNEGEVEWPPSPYRLLRALYDAWKRKHAEVAESDVGKLLSALAAESPGYRLPEAIAAHTRSYLNSNTFDPTEKSLVFDAFVAVSPGASLYLTWPNVRLTEVQLELLDRLLGSLNYVGRSESWVEARVHDGAVQGGIPCEPMAENAEAGEMVPVACAVPESLYAEKRPWLDAIAYSTAEFQKDRRSMPPAMRMVPYVRPADAIRARALRPQTRNAGVQAVLMELSSSVLPLVTATVEVAEQVRVRLMGIHKRITGDARRVSPVFSGKTPDGEPRKDHQHVFILPLANDRGRIAKLLLYTRSSEGFSAEEVQAMLQMTELYGRSSEDPIRVMATWRGKCSDERIRPASRRVSSTTPFIAGRHWRKGRGSYAEFLMGEVRRECRNHGLPEPSRIEMLQQGTGLFEWVEFRRNRKDDIPRPGYGFRLEFNEPVPAPFSLGYGCHFGLGQFAGD